MDDWRENGSDPGAPVRAKEKADGVPYGIDRGRFVPAFQVEFEELPIPHGTPGDRRLRWSFNPAHPLHDYQLAEWARPTDPGDRLFDAEWEREVECRYQLFVQAIHEDNVNLLSLLDAVNYIEPRLGRPLRSDTPAGQLDVMYYYEDEQTWVFYDQYRPYVYSAYCANFGKAATEQYFLAKETLPKFALYYQSEEARCTPNLFRPLPNFPGV